MMNTRNNIANGEESRQSRFDNVGNGDITLISHTGFDKMRMFADVRVSQIGFDNGFNSLRFDDSHTA